MNADAPKTSKTPERNCNLLPPSTMLHLVLELVPEMEVDEVPQTSTEWHPTNGSTDFMSPHTRSTLQNAIDAAT